MAQPRLLILQLGQTCHHLIVFNCETIARLTLQLSYGPQLLRARGLQLCVLGGHRLTWLLRFLRSRDTIGLNLYIRLTIREVVDALLLHGSVVILSSGGHCLSLRWLH